MRTNQSTPNTQSELTLKGLLDQNFSSSTQQLGLAYHEMDIVPVREVNEIAQLSSNIEMLSNLRYKIQFMNREIRYLMKV